MKLIARLFVTLFRLLIVAFVVVGTHRLWTGAQLNDAAYFTDQSNLAIGFVMLWAAIATATNSKQPPAWLKGCFTLYIIVTGLVANTILCTPPNLPPFSSWAGCIPSSATNPYVLGIMTSTMLHVIVPIMATVDFLLFDRHRRMHWHYALTWIIYFPIYLAILMVRAHFWPTSGPADWSTLPGAIAPPAGAGIHGTNPYPYGFIDFNQIGWTGRFFGGSYHFGLAQNVPLYMSAFFVLGLVIFAIDRLLPRRGIVRIGK